MAHNNKKKALGYINSAVKIPVVTLEVHIHEQNLHLKQRIFRYLDIDHFDVIIYKCVEV